MSEIKTKPATKEYRANWDSVFGPKCGSIPCTINLSPEYRRLLKAETRQRELFRAHWNQVFKNKE